MSLTVGSPTNNFHLPTVSRASSVAIGSETELLMLPLLLDAGRRRWQLRSKQQRQGISAAQLGPDLGRRKEEEEEACFYHHKGMLPSITGEGGGTLTLHGNVFPLYHLKRQWNHNRFIKLNW